MDFTSCQNGPRITGDGDYRVERDSLGEIEVPIDAYWGAQTQRAVENFPIFGITFGWRFVRALGVVKKAAVQVNRDLGMIDEGVVTAIVEVVNEATAGELDDQLSIDVFQTGSDTSSSMNASEVIANRVAEIMGEGIGDRVVHPNDHVNLDQSSNDMIPAAMHVVSLKAAEEDLPPALETLATALGDREAEFDGVVKASRTYLQDATPVRLGQESGGYRTQIERGIRRVENTREYLNELALGGTAVGTGLSTHPEFLARAAEHMTGETGVEFREADNHLETQATHDVMSEARGALHTVAGSLNKIADDFRLLASDPRNGLEGLEQPENQPGSSTMPGKINLVVAEVVNQTHKQAVGNDIAVSAGVTEGQIGLDLYKPVLAHNFLESAKLPANSSEVLTERFVAKLEVNEEHCETRVEQSMVLATVLNPAIGYDKASRVAKKALTEGKSVRQVAVDEGYPTEAETGEVFDPEEMTYRGILDDN